MIFQLTLNMPNRDGHSVHQITCEHETAKTLEAFLEALEWTRFIVVNEFYKDGGKRVSPDTPITLRPHGPILLNTSLIGKVREFVP